MVTKDPGDVLIGQIGLWKSVRVVEGSREPRFLSVCPRFRCRQEASWPQMDDSDSFSLPQDNY